MAKLYNLARMTTATTGTGTITLGSAVPSYVTFAAAGAQNGETVTYAIADGNNREVGRGVYTSSGTTLTRDTILESTNNNLAVNLSGNAEVFITAAAEDIANVNEINTFTTNQIITTSSANAALRITQTGAGNAIVVEDSSNPDSSPFVVNAEGRVGVGEDVPVLTLHVAAPNASAQTQAGVTSTDYASDFKSIYMVYSGASTTGTTYGISNADLGSLRFQNTSNALIGTNGGAPLILATNSLERMRITSGGNVGIGINNPSAPLQILGSTQNRLWLSGFGINSRQLFVRASGTVASPTIVSSGDAIGSLNFFGYDGATNIELANITATVDTTPGTNDMPGRLTFSTTLDGASSPTERLRIANNGNVLVTSSAGLGYGAGSGGTVTQATSKSTAVTLNKPAGQITMNNAALAAATSVTFTLNNSLLTAQDTLIVNHSTTGGTSGAYLVETITVGAGTVVIRVTNITGGSLSEAAVINFTIIKGVTS